MFCLSRKKDNDMKGKIYKNETLLLSFTSPSHLQKHSFFVLDELFNSLDLNLGLDKNTQLFPLLRSDGEIVSVYPFGLSEVVTKTHVMVLEIEKRIFHAILLQNNIYSNNEFQSYVNNHKIMSDKEAAENLKKIWQSKVIEKATSDPDYWVKQYELKNNIITEKQNIRYECKVCSSKMTINCDTCQTKNVEECVYVNESHAINMSLLIDYYLFNIEIVAKGTQLNRIKNQIKGFSFFDRDLDDEKDGIFSIEDLKMKQLNLTIFKKEYVNKGYNIASDLLESNETKPVDEPKNKRGRKRKANSLSVTFKRIKKQEEDFLFENMCKNLLS